MNIFVSVGTMLPFDRLVRGMDVWSGEHPEHGVCAQIGRTDYKSKNMRCFEMISPAEFQKSVAHCDVFISHAGVGNIVAALMSQRSIILLPRLVKYGEHTSDHQVATANWAKARHGVFVINDIAEVDAAISLASSCVEIEKFCDAADESLVLAVRNFIQNS